MFGSAQDANNTLFGIDILLDNHSLLVRKGVSCNISNSLIMLCHCFEGTAQSIYEVEMEHCLDVRLHSTSLPL